MEELYKKLVALIERSEERIDRTNEMVIRLGNVVTNSQKMIERLTDEYTRHLGDLSKCRDALVEQNKTLLQLHVQDSATMQELRHDLNDTRERVFELLKNIGRGIHIENK